MSVFDGIVNLLGPLSSAVREELLHCAISLVDRRVGVRVGCCIRVGDRDPPERLTRERARLVFGGPFGVPQGVVLVSIPMWPPVDGDGGDIVRWIETCR